jgi:hypothetical protein
MPAPYNGRIESQAMQRIILVLLFIVVGVTCLGTAAGVWLAHRDPLAALPRPTPGSPSIVEDDRRIAGRRLFHVVIDYATVGRVGFTVSLPDPVPAAPIPVVFVLGGLGRGGANMAPIRDAGANALIGFDWPIPPRLPKGLVFVRQGPDLHGRLMAVPGQVLAALDWALATPWADGKRISILGFSLGALAAPALQRLAAVHGRRVGWTVLAYGGAGLGDLLSAHPRLRPTWARPLLGALADVLLRPIEPAVHPPHLEGSFLVLAGRDDRLVPAGPAARLRDLTPEPKTVVLFDGDHMGVGANQRDLLTQFIAASRDWLVAEGAVNEP